MPTNTTGDGSPETPWWATHLPIAPDQAPPANPVPWWVTPPVAGPAPTSTIPEPLPVGAPVVPPARGDVTRRRLLLAGVLCGAFLFVGTGILLVAFCLCSAEPASPLAQGDEPPSGASPSALPAVPEKPALPQPKPAASAPVPPLEVQPLDSSDRSEQPGRKARQSDPAGPPELREQPAKQVQAPAPAGRPEPPRNPRKEAPVPGKAPPAEVVQQGPGQVVWPAVGGMGRFNSLTPQEQMLVNAAIDRGVAYLLSTQLANGSWSNTGNYQVGYSALAGLALLECGAPPAHPAIQKAALVVRSGALTLKSRSTYQLSLAILFLDRLGVPADHQAIQLLALRLLAGQNAAGGWDYECPGFMQPDHKQLLASLPRPNFPGKPGLPVALPKGQKLGAVRPDATWSNLRKLLTAPQTAQSSGGRDDNSNTQFAIMALWAARRHLVPTAQSFALIGQRFRGSQAATGGWGYHMGDGSARSSMTCVGLLGLATSHGSAREALAGWAGPEQPVVEDPAITRGLLALGTYLNQPQTKLNTYFLWAVERVGVLYNLPTLGNVPWYRWGVTLLLPTQRIDGSWFGHGYSGSSAPLDTAMALLFLKRANLAPDLTTNLRRYVVVADPAAVLAKGQPQGPQPMEVWLQTENPDDPPVRVPLLAAVGAARAKELVTVMLGDAKTGTQTERRITVRCAIPFRITGIKGTDRECGAEADNHERKTEHVLTIRLQPKEPGNLTRNLRLLTDVPNGGIFEFNVKAQAVKER